MILSFLLPLCVNAEPLRVGVSVLPLESIVSEIGGSAIEVRSLQQEGDSCSVFEPRPSSVAWLSRAGVFFRTGVGFESVIMDKLGQQFAEMRIVDLRDAVTPVVGAYPGHDHHGHGHACSVCGSGTSMDPHIWLDPRRLTQMASLVESTLIGALPDSATAISRRAAAFRQQALSVDARLRSLLAPYAGRAFFIYHPALGYFADRYNLEQVAISMSNRTPTARELHRRIEQARDLGVRVIFIQPQESRRHAEIIADAIGAELVEIDPMETDWKGNLLGIAEALAGSFARE